MTQVLHITPAAVAGPGTVAGVGQRCRWAAGRRPRSSAAASTRCSVTQRPGKGLLTGLEVGLGKWADNDVVTAIRPIFTTAAGEEILGQQHGADTSHVTRVTAKPGYAVGGLTAKAAAVVNGFSVTFMKIDGDRLDPKQTYQSDWIGGRNGGQESRLGGDGAAVVGIVRPCEQPGLHGPGAGAAPRGPAGDQSAGRRHTLARAPCQRAAASRPDAGRQRGGGIRRRLPLPAGCPARAARRRRPRRRARVTRSLPEPADDVAAGGNGRYLFLHLPKLRKLAVFDVQQAKIAGYLPMSSDNLLFAAGAEKLIVILRDQGVVQRYDLATQKKELSVTLPEAGQAECMALGYASAGPALLMTDNGPRFLDLAKLSLVEIRNNRLGRYWWGRRIQVRASANGGTFAGWGNNGSPSGLFFWNIDGDAMRDHYEHVSAGCASPSYDGKLVFTGAGGIYSANLRRQTFEQLHDATYLPACHPAYFMGFSGVNRLGTRGRPENLKPKLSLYTIGDKRLLLSFNDLDEISDVQESPYGRTGALSIDKRIHYFPTANLLVVLTESRDQLVLHKLDLAAAMEKAGIDYLYVTSTPPATASPGSTLAYQVEVKSRRGGVHCTLDSGPEGMTVSDDGKLAWKVPAGQSNDRQGVIITIKDASGQEIMHTFNLAVH